MDHDEERAALNGLVREAHEAIKDLNRAMRAVDDRVNRAEKLVVTFNMVMSEFEANIKTLISNKFHEHLDEVAVEKILEFKTHMDDAMEEAEKRIYTRFDLLLASIMDSEKETKVQQVTVSDMIEAEMNKRGF